MKRIWWQIQLSSHSEEVPIHSCSYWKISRKCKVLPHLKLCLQNHSGPSVEMHQIQIQTSRPQWRKEKNRRYLQSGRSSTDSRWDRCCLQIVRRGYEKSCQYAPSISHSIQSLSLKDNIIEVDAKIVYDFTGSPSPDFLSKVMDTLFNENIERSFKMINGWLKEGGIALETILKSIYLQVIQSRMPVEQQTFLVNRLGDIEYRLSIGCQEKLALSSLIGAFS